MGVGISEAYALTLDGITLFKNTSIEVRGTGEDADVFTTLEGWAGQSLAPRKSVINVESVVMQNGLELDIFDRWINGAKVPYEIVGLASGKRMSGDCFIRNPTLKHGVGQTPMWTAELHGDASTFV